MITPAPRIVVREARADDADVLLRWRNDELSRRMSLEQGAVSTADHARWYAASLANPDRIILIAEEAGAPVGMCRFDIDADRPVAAEISINLAPEQRGRGLGSTVIDAATEAFAAMRPGVNTLTATIRLENVASIRLFESRGFRRMGSVGDAFTYERGSLV